MTRNALMRRSLLFFSFVSAVPASGQTTQRPARVEVVVPKPPVPVLADGKRVLVYELHLTNFGRGALGFREINVLNGTGTPIVSYRDSALTELLNPVGAAPNRAAQRLDPGQRTVVFLWLSFPPAVSPPTQLRHRIVFDILDTADVRRDRGTQTVLDSIFVPVSRESDLVLRAPLDSGEWVMGSGPSNTSAHRRALNAVGGAAHIAERFAIDWVKIGPNGNTYHDDEHRNENYWAFGQPVHAVAPGQVVAAVDSIADNVPHATVPPVTLANIAGNYVTVRMGPNRYATYAHLKRGSVRVHVGTRVSASEVIGLLGNTGQSTAPHLHFQITDGQSVLASEGVPFVLDRFRFLGYANDFEEAKHPNEPRRRELPVDGEVIGLP
jgi:murein DD-endopeptidase